MQQLVMSLLLTHGVCLWHFLCDLGSECVLCELWKNTLSQSEHSYFDQFVAHMLQKGMVPLQFFCELETLFWYFEQRRKRVYQVFKRSCVVQYSHHKYEIFQLKSIVLCFILLKSSGFPIKFPFKLIQKYAGKNVYAILRAPRSSSTEAVVLSVPYRPPSSVHPGTTPSVAVMLALAKFFRRKLPSMLQINCTFHKTGKVILVLATFFSQYLFSNIPVNIKCHF